MVVVMVKQNESFGLGFKSQINGFQMAAMSSAQVFLSFLGRELGIQYPEAGVTRQIDQRSVERAITGFMIGRINDRGRMVPDAIGPCFTGMMRFNSLNVESGDVCSIGLYRVEG